MPCLSNHSQRLGNRSARMLRRTWHLPRRAAQHPPGSSTPGPAQDTTAPVAMKGRQPCGSSQRASSSPFFPPKPLILSQEKPAGHLSFLTPLFLSFKTIPFRSWKPFFLRGPFLSVTHKLCSRAPSGCSNHFLREERGQRLVLGEKESHIEPITPCKPEPKMLVQTSAPIQQELPYQRQSNRMLFFQHIFPPFA